MTRLPILCLALAASTLLTSCQSLWMAHYRHMGRERQPLAQAANALETLSPKRQPLLVPILHEGRERYQLWTPWTFERAGHTIEIPEGLVVDGASVPRAVWCFMPPDGIHRGAALAHDWTYLLRGRLSEEMILTREQADTQFYGHLIDAGLSRWRAGIAYRAVRLGGGRAWNSIETPTILPVPRYAVDWMPVSQSRTRHLYAP